MTCILSVEIIHDFFMTNYYVSEPCSMHAMMHAPHIPNSWNIQDISWDINNISYFGNYQS